MALLSTFLISFLFSIWRQLRIFLHFSFISKMFSLLLSSYFSICFHFCLLGLLSSQLDNEECSVTLTSISPCVTFWLCYITFDLLFDSLINYPVLWFMSKCYVKIIDNRWSSENFLWHVFFHWLTWWSILSRRLIWDNLCWLILQVFYIMYTAWYSWNCLLKDNPHEYFIKYL